MRGDLGERGEARSSRSTAMTRRAPSAQQRTGQPAGARADLDDGHAVERPGGAGDARRQVEIEQEILAERLLGRRARGGG